MARYEESKRDEAYRFYLTDILYLQGRNQTLSVKFSDIISPSNTINEAEGDAIVDDIFSRYDLKFEAGEGE